MKKNIIVGLVVAGALVMTGCASSPSMQKLAEDQSKAEKVRAEAAAEKRAQEQARMEETLKAVPAWALEVPRPDSTGIFAVGMSESDTLRVALRKAMLEAEYGLAKTYNQELSGSERSYTQDNGGQTTSQQYTALIDKLVTQVPVSGFEVVHQEIKPIGGKYNAFVLLKLPYEQFNRTLQDQRAKSNTNDKTISAAFDDLGRRLKERRQQRLEDQQVAAAAQPAPEVAVKPVADSAKGATATAAAVSKAVVENSVGQVAE